MGAMGCNPTLGCSSGRGGIPARRPHVPARADQPADRGPHATPLARSQTPGAGCFFSRATVPRRRSIARGVRGLTLTSIQRIE